MRTSRSAYSLIEILVTSALMLVLLGGVYQIVRFGLKYWQVARAGETVHQDALACLRRMEMELAQSNVNWVVSGTGSVVFPSPMDADNRFLYADGELLWTRWMAFYLRGRELVQSELAFAPAVTPPTPPPDLTEFQLRGTERVLARNVKSFVAGGGYPGLVRLSITTSEATGSGQATELTLSTQMRPGN